MLDKNNAAVLLVNHQTGLLSLVGGTRPDTFKNNVLALISFTRSATAPGGYASA